MQLILPLAFVLLAAVPSLDQRDHAQLDAATDGSARIDEGAIYPLLRNIAQWQGDARPGARLPDYPAMMEDPAAWRGQRVVIEGRFLAEGEQPGLELQRAGPWGEHLREWRLMVGEGDDRQVVMVYLVDPGGTASVPRTHQPVRVVGRFFKKWLGTSPNGREGEFLVFVGRDPQVLSGGPGWTGNWRGGSPLLIALLLLVGLFALMWRVRRWAARPRDERPHARAAVHQREPADDPDNPDEQDLDLPEDPGEALEALARRRAQQQRDDQPH